MATYDLSLDARAANVRYYPSRGGPIEQGWNYLSKNGSVRSTTFVGAKIEIDWVGTAVRLYGVAAPSTYRLSLDGRRLQDGQPGSDGTLGGYDGLDNTNHTVAIEVVKGLSEVRFSHARLTLQLGKAGCVHSLSPSCTNHPLRF
jgi:hypothetical protein